MFKSVVKLLVKNMSSERIVKETLARKLSGRKVPRKIDSKAEQAENKSQFFNEINNQDKANKKKAKEVPVKVENIAIKSEVAPKRSTRKLKKQSIIENTQSSLEIVINAKPVKATKSPNKTKASIVKEEEPCSSKKIKQESSDEIWQPANWQTILENIRKMRTKDSAPVDTMGCHKCADENADEKTQRFHKLVALMLSSQTKDETTYHAMLRLREQNLTPEVICQMKVNVLENILHPVSFYKNKAKYLQQTAKILVDKYDSDIPNNIKELVALPGVGPKMAHICMSTAWHEVTGIGVDVHVHRISNRIGWLPKSTKEPEQTRLALEKWLPQQLWSEVNHLLVGFGQTICTPVKPKCSECLNCEICPSATKVVKNKTITNKEILDICDNIKYKKTKLKA
ncbi:endonuclease III-like protein 1 [Lucilia sericata]|uniref:endonuclease III-like protein 1 n=1 Tax=Lucilia sericata TaxID=13632 RepID=UPI0018A7F6A2|nr:endonuclease III-like protein 1 [Lucilia sericata]XP_037823795.1 endonuclease III-like protein 1 [Lucilia sericata]